MKPFAIVAIGYNRPDCMLRLLTSLENANYNGDRVPLIVSIDNSGNEDVIQLVDNFYWSHGTKIIKTYPKRLGLRRHILACGDLTNEYEHIAVFEDDLYVSDSFYNFAKKAAEFYENDDRIAGIALYSHMWNVGCNRPFLPINDQYDVFFMQYACSWGQVWSKDKWSKFMKWYKENDDKFLPSPYIPKNITEWSNDSWLKYHIKYCIETNRFFVYPKAPLATNFSSKGQHNIANSNGFQVPLQFEFKREYVFPCFGDSIAKYDAYFEYINIYKYLALPSDSICVDLYGMKNNNSKQRYWVTLKSTKYKVLQTFDMCMRPQEMNVIHKIGGNKIKLYDTSIKDNKRPKKIQEQIIKLEYDFKNISYRTLLKYILVTIFNKMFYKLSYRGK